MKLDQPPKHWDRLFAPSSSLAVITSVDWQGRVNAAANGTCTRVNHEPVCIALTVNTDSDTARNVLSNGEFVVNLPSFDRGLLEKVRIVGLPFAPDINELEVAGLCALPSRLVKPPRIVECQRHFECRVAWTKAWGSRLMVVGELVAASVDAGCVDEDGYIRWDVVKPVHYCGAPYGGMFVGAYETMTVDLPFQGPEVAEFHRRERAMFKEI